MDSISDVGLMLTTDSVNQITIRPDISIAEYLILRLKAFNFGKFDIPELVTNKILAPMLKMLNRELKNKLFTISHLKIKGKRIYKLSTDTAR